MYLEMACAGKKNALFCSWGLDYTRVWRLTWDDKYWRTLCKMFDVFMKTKNGPWEDFAKAKFFLKRESARMVNEAVVLHPGKGWPSSI